MAFSWRRAATPSDNAGGVEDDGSRGGRAPRGDRKLVGRLVSAMRTADATELCASAIVLHVQITRLFAKCYHPRKCRRLNQSPAHVSLVDYIRLWVKGHFDRGRTALPSGDHY